MADIGLGGGLNTFVPTFSEATGLIQTEFTRNVKTFALNRYTKLVPVTQTSGYYLRINSDEAVRVVSENDFAWAYGEDRPTGINNDFEFTQYTTKRFEKGFTIPYETARVAAWDIVAQHARSRASQLMTLRTNRALGVLTDSANWTASTNYFVDYDALTSESTASGIYTSGNDSGVQKLFQKASEKILINTGGAVQMNDIIAVMSPATAFKISQTAGMRDILKYQAGVNLAQGNGVFSRYGLTPTLFGIGDVVIEDAVKITSQKGATKAASYILALDTVLFVSRPQGLVGVEGGASFATFTNFVYEDMTVETMDDPKNRRTAGSIVDNYAPVLTAPLAGLLVANIGA